MVGCLLVALASGVALLAIVGQHAARADSSEALLPNLIADPPDGAKLVTSSLEDRTHLLLRFNGYLHNQGPGALEMRGSRAQPHVAGKTETELHELIRYYKEREESLPANIEAELAVPTMGVSQRLYTTNEGNPAESARYLERPHTEEASPAEMAYSNADGHHHWHLLHIARYSLWNVAKNAEVAPSQKVGFCLEDSQHVEADVGPSTAVYAQDAPPYPGFCRRYEPNTTGVYEGISPGWRDIYSSELAFQWVDVSDVIPGEYWLREEVDPDQVIHEAGGGTKVAYSTSPIVIPGFDAEGQSDETNEDEALQITLGSRAYQAGGATPQYSIATQPRHGTLSLIEGDRLIYTPASGYSGADSFTFSARDPQSEFPEEPEVASISIDVHSTQPTISIDGAQQQMTAGTSATLSASVTNDAGSVQWEASGGTIEPVGLTGDGGLADDEVVYTAPVLPPPGGTVTVTARLQDHPATVAQSTIAIEPASSTEPAPEPPSEPGAGDGGGGSGGGGTTSSGTSPGGGGGGTTHGQHVQTPAASISRPRVMLVGRVLVMSTRTTTAGFVRLIASLHGRRLGGCGVETMALRTFTCRLRLRRGVSLHAPIGVRATLQFGAEVLDAVLPARRIPEMKMRPVGNVARAAASTGVFWCTPSTLGEVLVGE